MQRGDGGGLWLQRCRAADQHRLLEHRIAKPAAQGNAKIAVQHDAQHRPGIFHPTGGEQRIIPQHRPDADQDRVAPAVPGDVLRRDAALLMFSVRPAAPAILPSAVCAHLSVTYGRRRWIRLK